MRLTVATALCLSIASAAGATTLVPAGLGEMTRDAGAIARGRVAAVDSRWSDDHRSVQTLVTLEVENYLKGGLGPTVQFSVPGGVLGRYRTIFVGAPQFAVDQRVVVFLAGSGAALPHLVGFSQGVFRVIWSPAAAAWIVSPALPLPGFASGTPGDRAARPTPLRDFEQRIRTFTWRRQ